MNIGIKIKNIRKTDKLTQSQFAKELGISRNSLINYEKGERTPPVDLLLNISKKFNVSMDNLVALDEDYSVSKEIADGLNEAGLVEAHSLCQKSSQELLLSNFKIFLKSNGLPVDIITDEDLKSLYKNTLSYIEFEIFKAGYIRVSDLK